MRPLTPRQQATLGFVSEFARSRGFAPSLREIGQAVGLANISAVRGHVAALEKKGCLKKEPDQSRSIRVVNSPSLMSRLKRKLHEFARTDQGVLHHLALVVEVWPNHSPELTARRLSAKGRRP